VRNVDRAVGTRLSGRITTLHGGAGLPEETVNIRLTGTAGQSLGAWLAPRVAIHLEGVANDGVGKGMAGGLMSITPAGGRHAAGNAILYGATGGRLFIGGPVGQRFAVRNSGATAVVEGCSDHGCEYMTGGLVVILGRVGRNFAAGMTGGLAYVWDPDRDLRSRLSSLAPEVRRPANAEPDQLRSLLEAHVVNTQSQTAARLLD